MVTVESAVACTIFTAVSGDTVLFGNNEDYTNPNTYIWFTPDWGQYGGVYVGFDLDFEAKYFNIQGGMNEKGLAFDANALPEKPLSPHPERSSSDLWVVFRMLQECATVAEAIDLTKSFNWGSSLKYQVHLADATGDAVVISAGIDRELNFTRKEAGNGFLVSTNFNRGYPENGDYPCQRYDTAVPMLEEIGHEAELTVNRCRDILDVVHAEGAHWNTLYSNIFDLRNRMIYLYYFHQYEEVVQLDLIEELAKDGHYFRISELFSQDIQDRAQAEYDAYQESPNDKGIPGFLYDSTILGLVGSIVIHWLKRRRNKKLRN